VSSFSALERARVPMRAQPLAEIHESRSFREDVAFLAWRQTACEEITRYGPCACGTCPQGCSVAVLAPACKARLLRKACLSGEVALATELLKDPSIDVNGVPMGHDRSTLLHLCVCGVTDRHSAIRRVLLQRNADVNAQMQHDWTPLCIAAKAGNIDAVAEMLPSCHDLNSFGCKLMNSARLDLECKRTREAEVLRQMVQRGIFPVDYLAQAEIILQGPALCSKGDDSSERACHSEGARSKARTVSQRSVSTLASSPDGDVIIPRQMQFVPSSHDMFISRPEIVRSSGAFFSAPSLWDGSTGDTDLSSGTSATTTASGNSFDSVSKRRFQPELEERLELDGGVRQGAPLEQQVESCQERLELHPDFKDQDAKLLKTLLPKNSRIRTLVLKSHKITDAGIAEMAACLKLCSFVCEVHIQESRMTCDGAVAVASWVKGSTTLTELDLHDNKISDRGAGALAKAMVTSKSVTSLDLNSNRISCAGAAVLGTALQLNRGLNVLLLQYNKVRDEGVTAISRALTQNRALCVLYLANNKITDTGVGQLAASLRQNRGLQALYLSSTRVSDAGATALARALKYNRALTELDLHDNKITPVGATELAKTLRVNNPLCTLFLGSNRVSDSGATEIAEALRHNVTLRSLFMHLNDISDDGAVALSAGLRSNVTLRELFLGANKITDCGAAHLAAVLAGTPPPPTRARAPAKIGSAEEQLQTALATVTSSQKSRESREMRKTEHAAALYAAVGGIPGRAPSARDRSSRRRAGEKAPGSETSRDNLLDLGDGDPPADNGAPGGGAPAGGAGGGVGGAPRSKSRRQRRPEALDTVTPMGEGDALLANSAVFASYASGAQRLGASHAEGSGELKRNVSLIRLDLHCNGIKDKPLLQEIEEALRRNRERASRRPSIPRAT